MDTKTSSMQKIITCHAGIANRLIDFFQSVSETFVEFKSVESFIGMVEHLYLSSPIYYSMDTPVDTVDSADKEESGDKHTMIHFYWNYENVECRMDALVWFDVYGNHVLINYIDFVPSIIAEYGSEIGKEYINTNQNIYESFFDAGVAKTDNNRFIQLTGDPDYDNIF